MLIFERAYWRKHPDHMLAGIDEAGRGPLAGPVVAAAVASTEDVSEAAYAGELKDLNDSKQLSPARREAFFEWLIASPGIYLGIGWASVAEIDDLNILAATHRAMVRAIEDMPVRPDHVLVDGLPVKGLPCASTAIVGGDRRSLLIAAASVVAKVRRDQHMRELDRRHPGYGFAENKGYGTAAHVRALLRYGPCHAHRRSFRPVAECAQMRLGLDGERGSSDRLQASSGTAEFRE